MNGLPVVVFSHLRWDFVYQRPQHLLTRMAGKYPVYVIEEPVFTPGRPPFIERFSPHPNLYILRLNSPSPEPGFSDSHLPFFQDLLLQSLGFRHCLLWVYTPMALPLADLLEPDLIIYDCMDELSAFDFAPPQLVERERELLSRADIVFTGGPSLYRAKKGRHPNVHCFPSSVDMAHFGTARSALPEPDDQARIPQPRLGFFGVIDERFDRDLLSEVAAARPDWHFVLVGPIVKIDPAALPQGRNLHYLGQRSYAELPNYLAGWDVCLLPFAQNAATRYISPTKTLEYMAAERPIVSTPIRDVAEPYGDLVYLAGTPQEFIRACHDALTAPLAERTRRVQGMRATLSGTSWDATAEAMDRLIQQERSVSRAESLAAAVG